MIAVLNLCVGDQLSITKDIGQKLGVGTNMHSSAIFHAEDMDASIAALSVEDFVEKADGFAGVFSVAC